MRVRVFVYYNAISNKLRFAVCSGDTTHFWADSLEAARQWIADNGYEAYAPYYTENAKRAVMLGWVK